MKLPRWLFWTDAVKEAVWDPFWWVILMLLILWIPFLRMWWWLFLPVMLLRQLTVLYEWWISWDYDYAKWKWITLELIPPKEILTPLKAMEDVFNVVWPTVYDTANFRDHWCDGELKNGPFWCSWEIVSTEGKVHFYVRALDQFKNVFEAAFYNHYPDLEIHEVPDFTKLVPSTVPNAEWDSYGEDYDYRQPDAYPIRVYEKFFEPQGEKMQAEEKRMDPILSLLETLAKLGPGEHYWIQFITNSVTKAEEPDWIEEGKELVGKLARRPVKEKVTLMMEIEYLLKALFFGPTKEGSGDKATYEWSPMTKEDSGENEMKITQSERDNLAEVENKLKKAVFRTTIRGIYVARRDSWVPGNRIILRSYMAHFNTNNLNSLAFQSRTRPKINYFWRKRRSFLRARKQFRNAILRLPPLFPERSSEAMQPILSVEEMATLYHFPYKMTGMISPAMGTLQMKKSGAPTNLPIE